MPPKGFRMFAMKMFFVAMVMSIVGLIGNVTAQQPAIEPGVPLALAKWRAANYSNVSYALNIALEKGAPLMTGTVEVSVDLTDEGARYPLVLDWRTTPFANDKDQPFANVVEVNGRNAEAFSRDALESGTLALQSEHILIPKSLLKVGTNRIKIEFASPIKTSGAAVTRYIDKQDGGEYVYSLFVPSDASMAFPVFDQPDLKARFRLIVELINTRWLVVSNTPSQMTIGTSSRIIHYFEETKPISTYVFAFAAGDFAKVSDPSNPKSQIPDPKSGDLFVRRSQAEKFKPHAAEVFRLNREAVSYLEDYFDYKFPFPKYDLVLIPEFPFGGMEHAGATFLRESSIIFPSEPTKNDLVARASLIFHEAGHQWFGDTVTMKWFDDLWLKEGFATFMAYKAMAKVMPEYNSWKIFYERTKQGAYQTDSTKGTTPIYQEINNLSAAKSAYGAIVYNKAPAFLKQAEFYLGEEKFRTAVRAFLKKHEFRNATWMDLVAEFESAAGKEFSENSGIRVSEWAQKWVTQRGLPIVRVKNGEVREYRLADDIAKNGGGLHDTSENYWFEQTDSTLEEKLWNLRVRVLLRFAKRPDGIEDATIRQARDYPFASYWVITGGKFNPNTETPAFIFPNYQDFGYGIFLLDDQSRDYVINNIRLEKDDFLRAMMWGALWDSVREAELDPKDYVELVITNIALESDESTIQTLVGRVGTAMNLYLSQASAKVNVNERRLEAAILERLANAKTMGQRITFYRALLNLGSSANAQQVMKEILAGRSKVARFELRTKDKFDIVTRLIILGDKDALTLLKGLEKTETSDDARRYAYAARAGIATAENKAKYWNDFVNNKEISESWIEAAFAVFNNPRHAGLTAPYLERALAELPNLKRTRKIFFVNGWLGSFIGGQRDEKSLLIVNKFLDDNPKLDKDLRLKILENADGLERAAKIRAKFAR
ncbi:MAG: ERAP1-like C-terminal domain-containing protein [Acidobacteria bacterium]|nr:ERAP1-like C-terminal domain-containing protein [Acidobacteriota bacterium]